MTNQPKPRSNPIVKKNVPPEAIDWFCPECGRYVGAFIGQGTICHLHRCGAVIWLKFRVGQEPESGSSRPTT